MAMVRRNKNSIKQRNASVTQKARDKRTAPVPTGLSAMMYEMGFNIERDGDDDDVGDDDDLEEKYDEEGDHFDKSGVIEDFALAPPPVAKERTVRVDANLKVNQATVGNVTFVKDKNLRKPRGATWEGYKAKAYLSVEGRLAHRTNADLIDVFKDELEDNFEHVNIVHAGAGRASQRFKYLREVAKRGSASICVGFGKSGVVYFTFSGYRLVVDLNEKVGGRPLFNYTMVSRTPTANAAMKRVVAEFTSSSSDKRAAVAAAGDRLTSRLAAMELREPRVVAEGYERPTSAEIEYTLSFMRVMQRSIYEIELESVAVRRVEIFRGNGVHGKYEVFDDIGLSVVNMGNTEIFFPNQGGKTPLFGVTTECLGVPLYAAECAYMQTLSAYNKSREPDRDLIAKNCFLYVRAYIALADSEVDIDCLTAQHMLRTHLKSTFPIVSEEGHPTVIAEGFEGTYARGFSSHEPVSIDVSSCIPDECRDDEVRAVMGDIENEKGWGMDKFPMPTCSWNMDGWDAESIKTGVIRTCLVAVNVLCAREGRRPIVVLSSIALVVSDESSRRNIASTITDFISSFKPQMVGPIPPPPVESQAWQDQLADVFDGTREMVAAPGAMFATLCGVFVPVLMGDRTDQKMLYAVLRGFGANVVIRDKYDAVTEFVRVLPELMKRVALALRSRSVKALFDETPMEIVELYNKVVAAVPADKDNMYPNQHYDSYHDFETDLIKVGKLYDVAVRASKNSPIMLQRSATLAIMRAEAAVRNRSAKKKAPFAIFLHGPSGQGKTTFAPVVIRIVVEAAGKKYTEDCVHTIQGGDSFLTGAHNGKFAYVLDDADNIKHVQGTATTAHVGTTINQFCNNIATAANMASLEDKGRVTPRPDCFLMTGNIVEIFTKYSNAPFSAARRFQWHVELRARPEFLANGIINPAAMAEANAALPDDKAYPDAWLFTVRVARANNDKEQTYEMSVLYADLNVYEFMQLLQQRSAEHFAYENELQLRRESQAVVGKFNVSTGKVDAVAVPQMFSAGAPPAAPMPFVRYEAPDSLLNGTIGLIVLYIAIYLRVIYYRREMPIIDVFIKVAMRGRNPQLVGRAVVCSSIIYCTFNLFMLYHYLFVWSKLAILVAMGYGWGYVLNVVCRTLMFARLWSLWTDSTYKDAISGAGAIAVLGTVGYMALKNDDIVEKHAAFVASKAEKKDIEKKEEKKEEEVESQNVIGPADTTTLQALTAMATSASCMLSYGSIARLTVFCVRQHTPTNTVVFACSHSYLAFVASVPASEYVSTSRSGRVRRDQIRVLSFATDRDLVVLSMPGLPTARDLSPYLLRGPLPIMGATMIACRPTGYTHIHAQRQLVSKSFDLPHSDTFAVRGDFLVMSATDFTVKGDCGSVYVGTVGGDKLSRNLVGIHSGRLATVSPTLLCTPIYLHDVENAVEQQGFEQLYVGDFNVLEHGVVPEPLKAVVERMKSSPVVRLRGVAVRAANPNRGLNMYSKLTDKSKLRTSVFHESLNTGTLKRLLGGLRHNTPNMRDPIYYSEFMRMIARLDDEEPHPDMDAMSMAKSDYENHLFRIADGKSYRPLTMSEAINGCKELGIPALRMDTAGGWGWPGKKDSHFHVDESGKYYPNEKLLSEFEKAKIHASRHELSVIFKASLKDEARPISKKSVRVFLVGQLHFVILVRMYLTPFLEMFNHNTLGECASGLDTMSEKFNEAMAEGVEKAGKRGFGAGDFEKWDRRISPLLKKSVREVLSAVAARLGIPSDTIWIMVGILLAIDVPCYVVMGFLFEAEWGEASGHAVTTKKNSTENSLAMRYSYFRHVGKTGVYASRPFRDFVFLKNCGDDTLTADSEGVGFTNSVIQRGCAELGMTYSSPFKDETEMPDYYPPHVAQFLKRYILWSPTLGRYVGSFEIETVAKALTFHRVVEAEYTRSRSTAESALYLLFSSVIINGDENLFEAVRVELQDILGQYFSVAPERVSLPSYGALVLKFTSGVCSSFVVGGDKLVVMDDSDYEGDVIADSAPSLKGGRMASGYLYDVMDNNINNEMILNAGDGFFEETKSMEVYEAGETQAVIVPDLPSDLSKIFARPIRIYTGSIALGAEYAQGFDPYALLLADPVIAAKVKNYYRFSATLCLSMEVNGSTQHYGRLRLSVRHRPFLSKTEDVVWNSATSSNIAASTRVRRMILGQLANFEIDVNESKKCLRVPYISGATAVDPMFLVVDALPTMLLSAYVDTVTLLQCTNGTDNVHYSVYGHFEDVTLDVPRPIPQGWNITDVMNTGVKYIKKGIDVYTMADERIRPIITAFAMLGFSRPLTLPEPVVQSCMAANLTNFDVADNSSRLSLAVDSGYAVDGRELGTPGADELLIAPIMARENLVFTTTMATTDVAGKFLMGCVVTPNLAILSTDTRALLARSSMTHTFHSFVTSMFTYWRATMVVRIKVVASPFHNGKLLLWHGPGTDYVANYDPPLNLVHSAVVDLREGGEVVFEIPWRQHHDMGTCTTLPIDIASTGAQLAADVAAFGVKDNNGYFVLQVLSPLRSTSSTDVVTVLMYTSFKDCAFYSPRTPFGYIDETGVSVIAEGFDPSGGESVMSLRQLAKRFVRIRQEMSPVTATTCQTMGTFYPIYTGSYAMLNAGNDEAYGNAGACANTPFNFMAWSPASYMALLFTLRRGSMRYKFLTNLDIVSNGNAPYYTHVIDFNNRGAYYNARWRAQQVDQGTTAAQQYAATILTDTATARTWKSTSLSLMRDTSGFVEVEIAYRGIQRAHNPRRRSNPFINTSSPDDGANFGVGVEVFVPAASQLVRSVFYAAGEDFNLFGMSHCPTLLYTQGPTSCTQIAIVY